MAKRRRRTIRRASQFCFHALCTEMTSRIDTHRCRPAPDESTLNANFGPEAISQALVPPSTFRLVPVMNAASGLASQATSPAISSPDPYRPNAMEPRIWSAIGPLAGFITVSIRPGCTLLIVISRLPRSLASVERMALAGRVRRWARLCQRRDAAADHSRVRSATACGGTREKRRP